MIFNQAMAIAEGLRDTIAHRCVRVEIAGSLRRRRSVVGDIELVAIPKWDTKLVGSNLFGEGQKQNVNLLYDEWATKSAGFSYFKPPDETKTAYVNWIKTGTPNIVAWQIKPDGFYWRGFIPLSETLGDGVKLDLFLTTPEKWGVILTIRTGSREFSHELANWARNTRGTPIDEGRVLNFGRPLETPEERDVFEALGLRWVEPEDRTDKRAVRAK